MPLRIDEIEGRPIVVLECTPDRIVVIDRDRIGDPHVLGGSAHVLEVVLKGELRRVHADHHQSVILVFLGRGADIGKCAQPIDAGVGPEVDEDDFPRRSAAESGGELSHAVAPPSEGNSPSMGK